MQVRNYTVSKLPLLKRKTEGRERKENRGGALPVYRAELGGR